eukprot:5895085-Amphidinium_carterae.1
MEFQDGFIGLPILLDKYVTKGQGRDQITREEVVPHPEDNTQPDQPDQSTTAAPSGISTQPQEETMSDEHLPSSSTFIPAGPSFVPAGPAGLPIPQGSPVVTPPPGLDQPRIRLQGKQSLN